MDLVGGVTLERENKSWTKEEVEYLMDSWGSTSIPTIAKKLNRSNGGVRQKSKKIGMGAFLDSGEYISLNQLMILLRGTKGRTYTINQWRDKGMPVKTKRVENSSFKVLYLKEFWNWAEINRTLIDFSKLEPLILGAEPEWLLQQRRADIENKFYKKSPWTDADDYQLTRLLGEYRFSYRELSLKLMRTEGAIKRRVIDLNIKARPIKMTNHNFWTEKETKILIELYHKGHTHNTMANYIERSAQACSGKVERLIKEGTIVPRSQWRVSC